MSVVQLERFMDMYFCFPARLTLRPAPHLDAGGNLVHEAPIVLTFVCENEDLVDQAGEATLLGIKWCTSTTGVVHRAILHSRITVS